MTEVRGDFSFTCDGCGFELEYMSEPEAGWRTACTRCASGLQFVDGKLMRISVDMAKDMTDEEGEMMGDIIERIEETGMWRDWRKKTCELVLSQFANTAMDRGLTVQDTAPAILALLNTCIERMSGETRMHLTIKVVRALGGQTLEMPPENEMINSAGGDA